jgi:serine/threonine protein kinase
VRTYASNSTLDQRVDVRTDVYAFGVILYQGLTGRPTFEAKLVAELLPAIVPRTSILPVLSPVAATEAAPRSVAQAGYAAPTPDATHASPIVRPGDSRDTKLAPMLLVSAATLFVLALGTPLIRRYTASTPGPARATAPRSAVQAGRVRGAEEERSAGFDAGAAAVAEVVATANASGLDAALLGSSRLVDAGAPQSAAPRPDSALSVRSGSSGEHPASITREGESQHPLGATPEKSARSSRRFRAGQARPSDF